MWTNLLSFCPSFDLINFYLFICLLFICFFIYLFIYSSIHPPPLVCLFTFLGSGGKENGKEGLIYSLHVEVFFENIYFN